MRSTFFNLALLAGVSLAHPHRYAANGTYEQETRSMDEIYQAALAEGGVVTLWHGGDEPGQQDFLKQMFETRFPNMTLNVTVDVSKYHDGNLDLQLAAGNVYIDSIILQTLHDYPRWKKEGALLNYAPVNFDSIYPVFKDEDAAYAGLFLISWSIQANTNKIDTVPTSYQDFTKPEFKDKIVLTYPNDDDAVLWQFDLLLKDPNFGYEWFEALLANNPRWVRGTATPPALMNSANSSSAATFTTFHPFGQNRTDYSAVHPTVGNFTSWAQTGAILKDAPHPEGAKLLHNYLLSDEYQQNQWSTRSDIAPPPGAERPLEETNSYAPDFITWMADRENVERLRFYFEDKIGTPQGLSPLEDDL